MHSPILRVVSMWCLLASALYAQAPLSRTGAITGAIRSADGAPAVGVRVAAVTADGVAAARGGTQVLNGLVRTDAEGRYRLEDLPAGPYYVLVGALDDPVYFPGVVTLREARAVTVTVGAATGNIDLTLPRLPAVRGLVTGVAAGVPSDLFSVALSPAGGGAPLTSTVKADGSFEFSEVPRGTYNVTSKFRVFVGRGGPPGSPLIEVGDRDVADIKVGLPPLIVGRVDIDDGTALPTLRAVFAPGAELPSQVSILAKLNKESLTHGWYARTDGWFATPAQAGQYTVAVSLPFGYRVKSKRQGSEDLTRGPLIVTETNATPVRITLTRTPHSDALPTFTVAGRIDGAAAVPAEPLRLSGASRARDGLNSIFGIAAENRMGEVSVQADGSFEFHGVPPGFYELTGSGLQPMTVVVTASDVRGIELGPSLPVRLQQVLSSPPSPAGGAARLKVSGKVTNLPANRELMSLPGPRILLGARLQTSMRDDGSFEFNNVAPGTYSLGWTGIQIPGGATGAMGSHTKVVVADRDVTGVTLELPFGISVFARVALKGDSDPSVPGVDKLYWAYRPIMSGGEVLADSSSGGIISFGVYAIIPRVPERYRLISLTADGVDVLKTGLWLDGSSNAVELLFTLEPVP